MKTAIKILTVGLAAMSLSGCITRTALTIENSPTQPVMVLQTHDVTSYIVMRGPDAYRYWRCVEQGDELVCYPDCGAKGSDLSCPGLNLD